MLRWNAFRKSSRQDEDRVGRQAEYFLHMLRRAEASVQIPANGEHRHCNLAVDLQLSCMSNAREIFVDSGGGLLPAFFERRLFWPNALRLLLALLFWVTLTRACWWGASDRSGSCCPHVCCVSPAKTTLRVQVPNDHVLPKIVTYIATILNPS